MKLSLNWLKDFVDIPKISLEDFAYDLSSKVVEVKGINTLGTGLENIVVGKIVRAEKHPNADQLKLCTVDIGAKNLSIVCGGSNVAEGMLVAVGCIGAKVTWHGEGDLVAIQKVSIRGEVSEGMICASDEIGLHDLFPKTDEKEIIDLGEKLEIRNLKLGIPLAEALGINDVMIEIDNSSLNHRPDLWGHYGMAREIAAVYKKNLKPYPARAIHAAKKPSALSVVVKDKTLCRAYSGVLMEGISIGPSPAWMQERLLAAGQRPINSIVDITNYVMFELGQPTHAFDAKHIEGGIVVREAREAETMVTLDGEKRNLSSEILVIADEKKPIALAGIMGGAKTSVSEHTTSVWFESANFDPVSVRKASKTFGLRTEGSVRWEKNQDPENALLGLKRLVALTQDIIPTAKIRGGIFSEQYWYPKIKPLKISLSFIEQKIGSKINKAEAVDTLQRLCFGVQEKKTKQDTTLTVQVPSWRATKDISLKEDLVEEIARMHGYNTIQTILPRFPIQPPQRNAIRDLQKRTQQILAFECGYAEVYSYSFESREWLERLEEDLSQYIELENPLAKDRPLLRRHLIPGLLEVAEKNLHRFDSVKVFEVGRVFHKETPGVLATPETSDRLPAQPTQLGFLSAQKGDETPFFAASGALERLFERLHVSYCLHAHGKIHSKIIHPGRFAKIIMVGSAMVGTIAELHPQIQEKLGIPYRAAIVQITLDDLVPFLHDTSSYKPLPPYPPVVRDVAFVVDCSVTHDSVVNTLQKGSPFLADVALFDVFSGTQLGEHKKSMAYHLTYQPKEKTWTSEEIDIMHAESIRLLKTSLGAEVRTS